MATRRTMRDVAQAAGVSTMTVSRVINGQPGVLPETAARVERAIRRLGYQRNDTARQLRRKGQPTQIIGMLVDDLSNPFLRHADPGRGGCRPAAHYVVLIGSSQRQPAPGAGGRRGVLRPAGGRADPGAGRRQPPLPGQPDGPGHQGRVRGPADHRAGRGPRAGGQPPGGPGRRPAPARPRPPAHRLPRRPRGRLDDRASGTWASAPPSRNGASSPTSGSSGAGCAAERRPPPPSPT